MLLCHALLSPQEWQSARASARCPAPASGHRQKHLLLFPAPESAERRLPPAHSMYSQQLSDLSAAGLERGEQSVRQLKAGAYAAAFTHDVLKSPI